MTLIDGDRIITAQLYDDKYEEFTEKKMSIIDYVNAYTDEGVTEADVVERLPSVEPERKPGKWVDGKCNRCGTHAPFWEMATTYYCSEYCPKCGAVMEVEK